jgi:uncharacterized membrane protein
MRLAVGRVLGVLIATAIPCVPVLAQEPIDLGTIPDYTRALARGINARGDVVGQATRTGAEPRERGVLWHHRRRGGYRAEVLPALPGHDRADARDFAGGRVPIGFSYVFAGGTSYRAVAWLPTREGTHEPLDLEPPPGFTDARAFAASLRGQVVGEAVKLRPTPETVNGLILGHAVSWRVSPDGVEACDLGVPEGFDVSAAYDVNERGDVVGTATRYENDGAGGLRRRAEVVVWLRPHRRPGACNPQPFVLGGRDELPYKLNPSINDQGDVVAEADSLAPGEPQAPGQPKRTVGLAWPRCGRQYRMPIELPVPDGFTDASARDINSRGEIAGTAILRSPEGATTATQGAVWRYGRGGWRITLLGNPAGTSGASPEQISDGGEVVGASSAPAEGQSGALLWRLSPRCRR